MVTQTPKTLMVYPLPPQPHMTLLLSLPLKSHHKYPTIPSTFSLTRSPLHRPSSKAKASLLSFKLHFPEIWSSGNQTGCLKQQLSGRSSRGAQAWERNKGIMTKKAFLWTSQRVTLLYMSVKTEADTLCPSLSWVVPSFRLCFNKQKKSSGLIMIWALPFLVKKLFSSPFWSDTELGESCIRVRLYMVCSEKIKAWHT